ncbi:MAG: flagellar hook-basal body complex protein, partial [Sulfurimonas sp.]|nr:flagellar hook-basal body complex protein [Sulfurimonas sp.]
LAIMGDGWFAIQGQGEPLYTRDGAFTFNSNRELVTDDGYYVLGTIGNNIEDGVLVETLAEIPLGDAKSQQKLRFPQELQVAVQPTTEVKFYANIGLEDTTRVMSGEAIDPQNNKNAIRLEFSKVDPQVSPGTQWNVLATAQSNNLVTVVNSETQAITYEPEVIYDTQTGVVVFDENGQLVSNSLPAIDNNGSSVIVNLGTGYDGIISINDTIKASSESNGREAGELVGYDINRNGEVVAAFSNGVQSSVATLAVYHFVNDGGLEKVSGTRYAESSNSGKAIFFQDPDGNNIKGVDITNYKLEGSNVEIETALTELIVMQRSYDANAKSITAAHEMLQKALDMDAK